MRQHEAGLIPLEEEVDVDPRDSAEKCSDSEKDSPVVNRVKTKKQKKKRKKSHKSKCKKGGVRQIKEEQVDCTECVEVRTDNITAVPEEAEAPQVEELEMFLHSDPEALPALQDLLVNKNLASHVREGPLDVYRLLAENREQAHNIIESNIDAFMPDDLFDKMLREEYPGGLDEFLAKKLVILKSGQQLLST